MSFFKINNSFLNSNICIKKNNKRFYSRPCPRCGKIFTRKWNLENHLKKKIKCTPITTEISVKKPEIKTLINCTPIVFKNNIQNSFLYFLQPTEILNTDLYVDHPTLKLISTDFNTKKNPISKMKSKRKIVRQKSLKYNISAANNLLGVSFIEVIKKYPSRCIKFFSIDMLLSDNFHFSTNQSLSKFIQKKNEISRTTNNNFTIPLESPPIIEVTITCEKSKIENMLLNSSATYCIRNNFFIAETGSTQRNFVSRMTEHPRNIKTSKQIDKISTLIFFNTSILDYKSKSLSLESIIKNRIEEYLLRKNPLSNTNKGKHFIDYVKYNNIVKTILSDYKGFFKDFYYLDHNELAYAKEFLKNRLK